MTVMAAAWAKQRVLYALQEHTQLTQAQLVEKTEMSREMVRRAINALDEDGFIQEVEVLGEALRWELTNDGEDEVVPP